MLIKNYKYYDSLLISLIKREKTYKQDCKTMKDSLSIIISNNLRSLEYLRVFINLKKNPNKIIYINDNKNSIIANKIKNIIKNKKI